MPKWVDLQLACERCGAVIPWRLWIKLEEESEQNVRGSTIKKHTPFVWNGKRRRRRERARLRRLGGSAAAVVKGYSIVN